MLWKRETIHDKEVQIHHLETWTGRVVLIVLNQYLLNRCGKSLVRGFIRRDQQNVLWQRKTAAVDSGKYSARCSCPHRLQARPAYKHAAPMVLFLKKNSIYYSKRRMFCLYTHKIVAGGEKGSVIRSWTNYHAVPFVKRLLFSVVRSLSLVLLGLTKLRPPAPALGCYPLVSGFSKIHRVDSSSSGIFEIGRVDFFWLFLVRTGYDTYCSDVQACRRLALVT